MATLWKSEIRDLSHSSHTLPEPQPSELVTHCLCLPEGIHDGAALRTYHPVVPQPGLGVDRFAHSS